MITKKMNLAAWVLVGVIAGIVTGIFFGESCTVFKPVGSAYVMLLQSVVYPYLVASLLYGLGRMSFDQAVLLFKRGWHFYIFLWGGIFSCIYLLSRSIPTSAPATAIDATVQKTVGISLLNIILPANFFSDITNNYVPAVVVFAILYGIAIEKFENKAGFLDNLVLVKNASVTIWNWIVRLAPLAVFAMFAHIAGTIRVEQLTSLVVYLVVFLFGTLFLAFYTLPALISSLAPARYREIFSSLQGAFILSAVTTLSVVSLPFIMEGAKKLMKKSGVNNPESDEIIETNLAISYPMGQLGNFFVYFFILFAAYQSHVTITGLKALSLPFLTLMSCIGSPSSTVNAVGFLSSWVGLPGDTMDLYVETMMLTRYGQVLLSVSGFAFLTFLISLSFFNALKIRPLKIGAIILVTLGVLGVFTFSVRSLSRPFLSSPDRHLSYRLPEQSLQGLDVTIFKAPEGFSRGRSRIVPGEGVLDRINRTRTLYVGYNSHIVPFSYFNTKGELVGYDIAFAYALAKSLNVKLVFVPFVFRNLVQELLQSRFDIAMSGTYMTNSRLKVLGVSKPYYQSEMGLIVRSGDAQKFLAMEDILKRSDLQIACLDDHELYPLASRFFPGARIVPLKNYGDFLDSPDLDAAMWTFTQSSKFAELHPGFTAVRPKGMGGVMICAYLTPPDSPVFLEYLNHFLEMKKIDGFTRAQIDYWIKGRKNTEDRPRWSVLNSFFSRK